MLDIKLIRQNPKKTKTLLKKRGFDGKTVDRLLKVDDTRKQLIEEIDKFRRERNNLSRGELEKGKKIKEELKKLEPDLAVIDEQFKILFSSIPNLPAKDVPQGKDEEDNVEIKKQGTPKKFDFKVKDHLELGEALDIINVEKAVKVSGSRFAYLKGKGALLEFALINFAIEFLVKKGFCPIIPPVINKKEIEWGLGYADNGGWDQAYLFEKDGIVFTSSSEHTIIPQHANETFLESDLPLKYVGFSTCFRREAGTYGKDTRGIFRLHQFDKVEMNVITLPDEEISDKACKELLGLQEELVKALELPFRVTHCCTGDLPQPNRRMYDVQVWFPAQEKYREIQSCSNCTDYQTRRLKIKVKTKDGSLKYAHALNATGLAIGRTIAAILENHQQEDGSVLIPKELQKYTGFEKISLKK